jgi:hypothetical protein
MTFTLAAYTDSIRARLLDVGGDLLLHAGDQR